jgi:hypothetical protein
MPINRVAWRNVHLHDASTGKTLGFYQGGSLTEASLVWILDHVLLILEDHWTVKHRASGWTITPSNNLVVYGDFDVYSRGTSFPVRYQRQSPAYSPRDYWGE